MDSTNEPNAAQVDAVVQPVPPEWRGDVRDPKAGCWHVIDGCYNSTCFGPDYCRKPCVPGSRYCAEHASNPRRG